MNYRCKVRREGVDVVRVDKTLSELWELVDGENGEVAKMAINAITKLQEENERLQKLLETAVFTNTDYEPKPKRTWRL